MNEMEANVLRESGIKQVTADVLHLAGLAYQWAAMCRGSMNPEIAALAPLYETIGKTWELHSLRLTEVNSLLKREG